MFKFKWNWDEPIGPAGALAASSGNSYGSLFLLSGSSIAQKHFITRADTTIKRLVVKTPNENAGVHRLGVGYGKELIWAAEATPVNWNNSEFNSDGSNQGVYLLDSGEINLKLDDRILTEDLFYAYATNTGRLLRFASKPSGSNAASLLDENFIRSGASGSWYAGKTFSSFDNKVNGYGGYYVEYALSRKNIYVVK